MIIGFASGIDPESPLPDAPEFSRIPGFSTRGLGRYRVSWVRAIESVGRLSPSGYPSRRLEPNGIPQSRSQERNSPKHWEFRKRVRTDVDALTKELGIQPSLVVSSAVLQAFVHNWEPGSDPQIALLGAGPRNWQANLLLPLFTKHL